MTRRTAAAIGMALIGVLVAACSKTERAGVGDLVKQVATEVRPKLQIQVAVRASATEVTKEDRELLRRLEEAVERQNIGRLMSSGELPGAIFLNLEVDSTVEATTKLHAILRKAGVENRATLRVIQRE